MQRFRFGRAAALALLSALPVLPQKPALVVQTGHEATVTSIAFSPDGKLLISGGAELGRWNVSTGHKDGYAFTSDGLYTVIRSWNAEQSRGSWRNRGRDEPSEPFARQTTRT